MEFCKSSTMVSSILVDLQYLGFEFINGGGKE